MRAHKKTQQQWIGGLQQKWLLFVWHWSRTISRYYSMSHVSVIRQCYLSSVSFCHSFIVCLCFAVCFICTFLWCARCSAQCMFLLCAQQLWRNCISKSACMATFGWNWMVCRKYICKMVVMTCFRFFVSVSAFDFSLYDFFEARPCVVCVFVYVWCTQLCLMREERIKHRMHRVHTFRTKYRFTIIFYAI